MTLTDITELRDYHLREAVIRCNRDDTDRAQALWHQRKAEGLAELAEALETHLPALTRAFGAGDNTPGDDAIGS
ncbi:MAG: hypothetical protein WC205_16775 [Opitutaceae bacterium]|jgi:hypothetical protein